MNDSDEVPDGFEQLSDNKLAIVCPHCGDKFKKVKADVVEDISSPNPRDFFPKLCKECKHADPFVKEKEFDGAKKISYPPVTLFGQNRKHHRTTYWAYDDCENCDGKGRVKKRSSYGGRYYAQCKECSNKKRGHPLRKAKREVRKELQEKIRKKYNSLFHSRLKAKGIDPDDNELIARREDEAQKIAEPILESKRKKETELRENLEERFEKATELEETSNGINHIKSVKNNFTIIEKPDFDHNDVPKPNETEQSKLF